MKNILLLISIFTAITFTTTAQNYNSVISTKSIWTSIDCFKIGTTEFKTIRKEMMNGDTTINGLVYKKMYRDTSGTFNWASAQYVCAVRENNELVHYVPNDGTGEKLLYDFTKNIGDSVEVIGMTLNYPNPIKLRIDSVFTTNINGVDRKTYKFNANGSYHTEEYWYEGIGSSFGFLTPFLSVSDNIFTLKCNSKNDTLYYLENNIGNFLCSNTEPANNCEYQYIATDVEDIPFDNLRVYPNPVLNKINIKSSLTLDRYAIYAVDGRKVDEGKLSGDAIDVRALSSGLYFLELISGDKLHRVKVVKD